MVYYQNLHTVVDQLLGLSLARQKDVSLFSVRFRNNRQLLPQYHLQEDDRSKPVLESWKHREVPQPLACCALQRGSVSAGMVVL